MNKDFDLGDLVQFTVRRISPITGAMVEDETDDYYGVVCFVDGNDFDVQFCGLSIRGLEGNDRNGIYSFKKTWATSNLKVIAKAKR
jgi:hypothetical protein